MGRRGFQLFGVDSLVTALESLPNDLQDMVKRVFREGAEDLRARLRVYAPIRTGRLSRSFEIDERDWNEMYVFSNVEYASWMNEGTKGHTITATQSPRLVWRDEKTGAWRSSIVVEHPGTEGLGFLEQATEETTAVVEKRLVEELEEVLKEMEERTTSEARRA